MSLKWKFISNKKTRSSYCFSSRKAFTLIELILVIAVVSIIIGIAVPNFFSFYENSKEKANLSNLNTLNKITPLFRETISGDDPFENEENSAEILMKELVNTGYLSSAIKSQTESSGFYWSFNEEVWELNDVVSYLDGVKFIKGEFKNRLEGKYSGSSKDIIIPTSIDGTDVTAIYQDVFNYSKGSSVKLSSLKFDDDSKIKQIHARAFENNGLTTIDFPNSLKRIDTRAFKNNSISKITFPPNLEKIEAHAFKNNKLTEIKLPNSLREIDSYSFENNENLDKITIGANVSIGDGVFNNGKEHMRTTKFKEAYKAGAGTYVWDKSNWNKQ